MQNFLVYGSLHFYNLLHLNWEQDSNYLDMQLSPERQFYPHMARHELRRKISDKVRTGKKTIESRRTCMCVALRRLHIVERSNYDGVTKEFLPQINKQVVVISALHHWSQEKLTLSTRSSDSQRTHDARARSSTLAISASVQSIVTRHTTCWQKAST